MSDWNETQIEAKEAGVLKRGMTRPEVEEALKEFKARGRTDPRAEQKKERAGTGRVPMGGFTQNLFVPDDLKEPGYYYRWFRRERIGRAKQAGFHPVLVSGEDYDPNNDDHRNEDQWFTVAKGRTQDGHPSMNYLMRQPEEFRKEDKALRAQQLDAVDEALKGGQPTGRESEQMYVPKDDQKIRETTFKRN